MYNSTVKGRAIGLYKAYIEANWLILLAFYKDSG